MAVISGWNEFETVSYKGWARQTEESYQLQLALALRLSSNAYCATDPNFLDPLVPSQHDDASASPEAISYRFWVNGCLSYHDKVPDGFYLIHGVDPYVWSLSSGLQEANWIPSFESLKDVVPFDDLPIEVVLIDKSSDPHLKELQKRVLAFFSHWITEIKLDRVVSHLAEIVCDHICGVVCVEEDCFGDRWKKYAKILKNSLHSIVLPLGSLSVGLCVHRAILFKLLADIVSIPCRIAKGCKYCRTKCASSCLVRLDPDREYVVDLIGKPGALCQPDSLHNGSSTAFVSSPLCHPRFRCLPVGNKFQKLDKLDFSDVISLNIASGDASLGFAEDHEECTACKVSEHYIYHIDKNGGLPSSCFCESNSKLPQRHAFPAIHGQVAEQIFIRPPVHLSSRRLIEGSNLSAQVLEVTHGDNPALVKPTNPGVKLSNELKIVEENQSSCSFSYVDDFIIPWNNLTLKEKIGEGSFGTVHRAQWCGLDVAVKILVDQDIHARHFEEFVSEVAIMKRLRHPNIILFIGAVTQPPHLSIVTEYLSMGSLYKLMQRPDLAALMDDILRLNMAYDVAKGMNYLHRRKPPIVHRDLKSLNLLVDDSYRVKVCDFGLSRSKVSSYLSSTAIGTAQWMAPEVLRAESSNEKSDVYSFGVILWELVTMQRPWENRSANQVIAAVGFGGQRLGIPNSVNPQVATLIEACWAEDPMERPSFSSILVYLKKLIDTL